MGAREVQVVLVAHRNAGKRPHLGEAPLGDGFIDAGRGVNRQSLGGFQKRMHRLIGGGDARKGGLGHFRGRELLGGKTRLKLANAHFSESTRH